MQPQLLFAAQSRQNTTTTTRGSIDVKGEETPEIPKDGAFLYYSVNKDAKNDALSREVRMCAAEVACFRKWLYGTA